MCLRTLRRGWSSIATRTRRAPQSAAKVGREELLTRRQGGGSGLLGVEERLDCVDVEGAGE